MPICTLDRLEQPSRAIFDRGPKTPCPATPTVRIDSALPSPGESAVKKIEAFIRHQAFEPIRSEPQAHSEEEVAAGAAEE